MENNHKNFKDNTYINEKKKLFEVILKIPKKIKILDFRDG